MGVGMVFGEAIASVRRNGLMSLASCTTVAVALFVLSVFLLMAVNVDHMAKTIESQLEVSFYLRGGLDGEELAGLWSEIEAIEGVTEVIFVSKEEALATLRQQLGPRADLLEGIEEMNPLRDSFRVFAESPVWIESVAASGAALDGVEDIGYQHELLQRLLPLTSAVRFGGLALVGVMVLATLLVISNTVRLTILARNEEVTIMKLVGATNWFIRWPFLLEGMLLGLAGAALAGLAAWQGYNWAVVSVYRSVPFIPVLPVYPLAWRLGLVLLGLGGVIGALGSAVSLRRVRT